MVYFLTNWPVWWGGSDALQ